MPRYRLSSVLLSAMIAGHAHCILAQQSDVSISPSLSRPAGTSELAGLALSFASTPRFALRASGYVAFKNTSASVARATAPWRPWIADVDAVFAVAGRPLGSRNRTAASYGFLGIGKSALDTTNVRAISKNWSYGVGTIVPLGDPIDLFADWRWRMSRFVLPTARPKPTRSKELRFGLSFHLASRD